MAGTPKWHGFLRQVDERGGEERMLERVASAETVAAIGRSYRVSRDLVLRYFKMSDERYQRFTAAKQRAGEAHLEKALDAAEDADPSSPAGVSKAKLVADTHRWIAGVRDKALAPASAQSGGTTINIGSVHLDALRNRGQPDSAGALPSALKRIADGIEDATIVSELAQL